MRHIKSYNEGAFGLPPLEIASKKIIEVSESLFDLFDEFDITQEDEFIGTTGDYAYWFFIGDRGIDGKYYPTTIYIHNLKSDVYSRLLVSLNTISASIEGRIDADIAILGRNPWSRRARTFITISISNINI